mmetsp:Transcript_28577/g.40140  ORF Transcript_28577/g.40140 Transcript_28577/m.40140 type:complete len:349 (-) Transcript_28577:277-1323(-)
MVAEESSLSSSKMNTQQGEDTTLKESSFQERKKKVKGGVKFMMDDVEKERKKDHKADVDDNENGNDEYGPSSKWILKKLKESPPPDALPIGWIMKKSRSQPSCYYYYNQETGSCRWETPIVLSAEQLGGLVQQMEQQQQAAQQRKSSSKSKVNFSSQSAAEIADQAAKQLQQDQVTTPKQPKDKKNSSSSSSSLKRTPTDNATTSSSKRTRMEDSGAAAAAAASTTSGEDLKEVRVLHLLRKHKHSRRPASWRNPKITSTVEEAKQELEEFLEIITEASTQEELRATFEELARTESDCSSAKRGGDLGFFGRRKMQPAFEKASFGLQIGELSGIVETSSGVHILLRIG